MRCLSKCRPLARISELREPFQRFLLEKQSSPAAHFSDKEWVVILAYLCNVFNLLNKLNLSVQGRMHLILLGIVRVRRISDLRKQRMLSAEELFSWPKGVQQCVDTCGCGCWGAPALGIHCPPLLSITQTCFCPLLTVLPQLPLGFTKSLTESQYPHQHNTQERTEHGKQGAI